jgi:putative transcriptional regulator
VAVPSETTIEIAPELFLTQDVGDLARLIRQPPEDLRLLLGYAGWGEGQLLEEILRNDWIVAPLDLDVIFDPAPESAWKRALLAAGVDPTTLPAWTATVDEEQAN